MLTLIIAHLIPIDKQATPQYQGKSPLKFEYFAGFILLVLPKLLHNIIYLFVICKVLAFPDC